MPIREVQRDTPLYEEFPFQGVPTEDTIVESTSKEDDLRSAKEAIAGPVPLMPEAPDCVVELPRGLLINGDWKTKVEIRELNGADEEALARYKEVVDFYDALIAHAVVRIDDYDIENKPFAERQGILQQLLIGEREQLLVAIARITYGNTKTLVVTCSECNEQFELDLDLSQDFPSKEMENPQQMSYTFQTSKGGEVEYRLATGADQWEALRKKGATQAEQNTTILSTVITRVNGGLVPDPVAFARRLSMKDRQKMIDLLVNGQPRVDMEVITPCVNCNQDVTLRLAWGDLFRP